MMARSAVLGVALLWAAASHSGAGETVSISGTIEYTGAQGPVSAAQPIVVLVWDNFDLEGAPIAGAPVETNGGAFDVVVPGAGTYYLAYILDSNGDSLPNVGDPFEIYQDRLATSADPIAAPVSDLDLSFDDSGALPGIRGTVAYL